MQIHVPIRYLASGRKAGNRINSSLVFEEMAEISIVDFLSDDAPVVASWDDLPPPNLMYPSDWGPRREQNAYVRFDGETFWRPMRASELVPQPSPLDQSRRYDIGNGSFHVHEEFATYSKVGHVELSAFADLATRGDIRNVLPDPPYHQAVRHGIPEDYFETVEFTNRSRVLKPIQQAASSICVVDGMMYVKCGEPCFAVMPMYFEGTAVYDGVLQAANHRYNEVGSVLRVITDLGQVPVLEKAELYAIQDYRSAIQATRKGNATKHQVKAFLSETNGGRTPTLFDALTLGDDSRAASEVGAHIRHFIAITETCWKTPLEDTAKLRMFCDLKDAVATINEEGSLDTVERTGADWLETYDDQLTRGGRVALTKAVNAASSRPIRISRSPDHTRARY